MFRQSVMYFNRLHYKGNRLQSVSDTRPRCQTPLSIEAAPIHTIISIDFFSLGLGPVLKHKMFDFLKAPEKRIFEIQYPLTPCKNNMIFSFQNVYVTS